MNVVAEFVQTPINMCIWQCEMKNFNSSLYIFQLIFLVAFHQIVRAKITYRLLRFRIENAIVARKVRKIKKNLELVHSFE